MANFIEVMAAVWKVEHNSNLEQVLHKNKTENTFTYYGIYPYTKLRRWRIIRNEYDRFLELGYSSKKALRFAGVALDCEDDLYQEVLYFYYKYFWKPLNLDYIHNTHVAKELMVFAVNIGLGVDSRHIDRKKYIIKAVQEIIGVKVDGIIGKNTIAVLNSLDQYEIELFSEQFDAYEITFYKKLTLRYKRLKVYLKGWIKRAKKV